MTDISTDIKISAVNEQEVSAQAAKIFTRRTMKALNRQAALKARAAKQDFLKDHESEAQNAANKILLRSARLAKLQEKRDLLTPAIILDGEDEAPRMEVRRNYTKRTEAALHA